MLFVDTFHSAQRVILQVDSESPDFEDFFVPCLFEEKRGDIMFGFPWCVVRGSEFIVGILRAQLLLRFLTNPSEILQMSLSWSENTECFLQNP